MPSVAVTLSIIIHMLAAATISWILNKLFSIDQAKSFMVYFILYCWFLLNTIERLYLGLVEIKNVKKEQN